MVSLTFIQRDFAKTHETKCNTQGVMKCNITKTQRIKGIVNNKVCSVTPKCVLQVSANHSTEAKRMVVFLFDYYKLTVTFIH